MKRRRMALNIVIAVEILSLVVVGALLLTFLPSLRGGSRSGAGKTAVETLRPPSSSGDPARAVDAAVPPKDIPTMHLPSRRFMKGLAAVPAKIEEQAPCFPAKERIEPAREIRWKSSRDRSRGEPAAGEGPPEQIPM